MPYQKISEANPAIRGINPPVTLAQANMIAGWADRIEQKGGADSPWGAAIGLFKKTHHVKDGKWVPNEGSTVEHSEPSDEEMEKAFDALVKALLEAGFEVATSEDLTPPFMAAEPAYVVDLFTALPQVGGKPDFSKPFRILPWGDIYRYGHRTVSEEDIAEFEHNWKNRTQRGIRRDRIVIDAEHEIGGIGWYREIFSKGKDGLWATISLSPNGRKLLDQRDFYFFSPSVSWKSQDRVTGDIVKNQIVGGALTNYPVFGDDTALPTLGYSEFALYRLWQQGRQIAGYATKSEEGQEYPASAYLVVEDPEKAATWHLRVKEFVDGKLQVTENMCGRAAAALGPKGSRSNPYEGPNKAQAKSQLRSLYLNTLKVPKEEIPTFSEGGDAMTTDFTTEDRSILQRVADMLSTLTKKGGGTMSDQEILQITPEQFTELQGQLTALKGQVDTLSQERDQLKQEVATGQTLLAAETEARALQEMKQHAQAFSHLALPLELPEKAAEGSMTAQQHFAWLQSADETEGKKHWAFFNEVLRSANAALEEAAQYTELGTGGGAELSEDEMMHQKAVAYAKEQKVPYAAALKAVTAGATASAA